MRTDGRPAMTNLTVAFLNLVKAPKSAYLQNAELCRSFYNTKPVLKTNVNNLKLICIIRIDSILTPQKTLRPTVRNTSQILLYSEGTADYSKDKKGTLIALCGKNTEC